MRHARPIETLLRVLTGLCAMLLVSAPPVAATTVVDRGIEGLVSISERVVVARVVDVRVRAVGLGPNLAIETETHLQIEHAIVGPATPETVTLVQPGGSVRLRGTMHHHHVPGAARFEPGEHVLVFLERTASGALVVAGLELGKFALLTTPDGRPRARRTVTAERVPGGSVAGAESVAGGLRLVRPEADDDVDPGTLIARIRRAAGRRVVTPSGWVP